jgi:hypothetical protein
MMLRALRIGVALGIAVMFSGVPQLVSAATDCCDEERCEGSLAGNDCPPACSLGACAKVRSAIGSTAEVTIGLRVSPGRPCAPSDSRPVLPVVTSGVFHPPRS